MATKFKLKIVTPKGVYFDGEVEEVVIGTINGPLGVMNNHVDTVVPLDPFITKIIEDKESKNLFTSEGVASINKEQVVLTVEACESEKDIDKIRAEAAKDRAEKRIAEKSEGLDLKRAEKALLRAMFRLELSGTGI